MRDVHNDAKQLWEDGRKAERAKEFLEGALLETGQLSSFRPAFGCQMHAAAHSKLTPSQGSEGTHLEVKIIILKEKKKLMIFLSAASWRSEIPQREHCASCRQPHIPNSRQVASLTSANPHLEPLIALISTGVHTTEMCMGFGVKRRE